MFDVAALRILDAVQLDAAELRMRDVDALTHAINAIGLDDARLAAAFTIAYPTAFIIASRGNPFAVVESDDESDGMIVTMSQLSG